MLSIVLVLVVLFVVVVYCVNIGIIILWYYSGMGRVVEGSYGYLLFCCGGIVEGVNFFIVLFLIGYLVKGIVVIS